MKLIKTTVLSGIITFIKISSGFVSTKIVANVVGPSGVALVGAFSNFIAIVLTFANGAINNGVVKYTAEYIDDEIKTKKLFGTALKISLYCSLICAVLIVLFSKVISQYVFKSSDFYDVIVVLGVSIIFYSLNSLLISILNGLGKLKLFTIVNALGSIVGLILTIVLVVYFKIKGALYALVLSQTIIFFITIMLVIKQKWLAIESFKVKFDLRTFSKLKRFSLMAIVTALTVPLTQLLIRNMITNKLSIDDAGIWQGMIRISDGYLMLINTALVTYYLPTLSSIKNDNEIRKEIFRGYRFIVPLIMIISCITYLLRDFIIRLLYNEEFFLMEELFFWQLLGDFFKILSFVLAYLMLAKSMTKMYIITEIFSSILNIVFTYYFLIYFGLKGSVIAFGLNYFIYFVLMVVLFRKVLFGKGKSL